jgi:hypothetical protein
MKMYLWMQFSLGVTVPQRDCDLVKGIVNCQRQSLPEMSVDCSLYLTVETEEFKPFFVRKTLV